MKSLHETMGKSDSQINMTPMFFLTAEDTFFYFFWLKKHKIQFYIKCL
jgi:hypothetical protein